MSRWIVLLATLGALASCQAASGPTKVVYVMFENRGEFIPVEMIDWGLWQRHHDSPTWCFCSVCVCCHSLCFPCCHVLRGHVTNRLILCGDGMLVTTLFVGC